MASGIKWGLSDIRAEIEKHGYNLLSSHYECNKQKLFLRCPIKHEYSASFSAFQRGQRCPHCCEYTHDKRTNEAVGDILSGLGFKMLSGYRGSQNKVRVVCSNGHEFERVFGDFIGDHTKCVFCLGQNPDVNRLIDRVMELGYRVQNPGDYVNQHTKLKMVCVNGHTFETSYRILKNGKCPQCSLTKPMSVDGMKRLIGDEPYEVVDRFKRTTKTSARYAYTIKCSSGHHFTSYPNEWRKGHRCQRCVSVQGSSKAEKEIAEFVRSLGAEVKCNDRVLINPYEIDILTSNKMAVEYCGIYWHSDKVIDKWYHIQKLERCLRANTRLLTIFEYEWLGGQESVKEFIRQALNNTATINNFAFAVDKSQILVDRRWSEGNELVKLGYKRVKTLPPEPHYINDRRQRVGSEKRAKYTMWDCGHHVYNRATDAITDFELDPVLEKVVEELKDTYD